MNARNVKRIALGLGWFSIGLGLVEVLAPDALARFLGVKPKSGLFRLYGLREIAVGVGILARPSMPLWFWLRAAGDVVDLATLGAGTKNAQRVNKGAMGFSMANVAAIGAADALIARELAM